MLKIIPSKKIAIELNLHVYFCRFEMFGIVQAKTALANSKITGIRNVSVQCLSMMSPIITDPAELPNLPTIIETQIAIALKIIRNKIWIVA